jgi:hypothetical protein
MAPRKSVETGAVFPEFRVPDRTPGVLPAMISMPGDLLAATVQVSFLFSGRTGHPARKPSSHTNGETWLERRPLEEVRP